MNSVERLIDSISKDIKIKLDEKIEENVDIDITTIIGIVEEVVLAYHLFTQKTAQILIDDLNSKYEELKKFDCNKSEKEILTQDYIKYIVTKNAMQKIPNYYQ